MVVISNEIACLYIHIYENGLHKGYDYMDVNCTYIAQVDWGMGVGTKSEHMDAEKTCFGRTILSKN